MNKRTARILLVEDDSVNQLVACLILRQQGIHVTVANNGAEALTQICSKAFQLVLMDIQMPIMDGYEATAKIRAMDNPYFKSVPIIAFTASAIGEVQDMATRKGMTDILNKPLDMEEFQQKMDKYIPPTLRPLSIDFNLYTDGDVRFKTELISHLIGNVKELQRALMNLSQNPLTDFLSVLHKVKVAVTMLSDRELTETLDEIKSFIISNQPLEFMDLKLRSFNRLCDQVIASLVAESNLGSVVTSRSARS